MKSFKKISLILIILFITSISGSVFAEDMNMDITYDIPSQANESDLTKEEKSMDRESYSEEAAKEENTSETENLKSSRSAAVKSLGTFTVSYAYAAKAKSSDKYATKVSFTDLKGYSKFDDAYSSMNSYYTKYKNAGDTTKAYGLCIRNTSGKIIAMKLGRAYATPSGATMNIASTYVTKNHELFYYSAKANSSTNSSVNVGISGAKGYVSSANLTLVPHTLISQMYKSASSSTKKYSVGYYSKNSSGELIHTYKTLTNSSTSTYFESGEYVGNTYSMVVDKAPSFMKMGTKYYSMDGVNFYTNSYLSSSTKAGTHYPYFKYLPYRTKSNYSASQFDSRIKNYSSSSVLRGTGKYLVSAQNTYGINALLELSFANLESAYGTSGYAISRKNLFGIAATDSNPDGASYFKSAGDCITRHAGRYLSQGYFDTKTDSRYFGTCPGDKNIGVAVKYASDPYHGEKISGIAYTQDKYMGSKDYGKYTIGKTTTAAYVYQKASTSSKKLYRLGTKGGSSPVGITVAIIGTSGNYYKVQSDMGIVNSEASCYNKYNFTNSVGYIPKSQITIIRKGSNSISSSGGSTSSSTSNTTKVSVTSASARPYTSYGFTPGYKNYLRVKGKFATNVKGASAQLRIYDSKNRLVAKLSKTKKTTKTTIGTFFWDGKATKGNTAGYKTGAYVKRSSKGTPYKFKLLITVNGKTAQTKLYTTKIYSKATKLLTDISKPTIKRKSKTTLSMKPNRPGTSYISIYNSKGKLVFSKKFYYQKANRKLSVSFKGYGNYGKYNKKLLAKGKYTVKFIHGSYTYKYPKKLVLK